MFWQYNINLNEEIRSAGYASLWLAVLNSCDWLILILSAFGEFFFNSLVVISIVATLTLVEKCSFQKVANCIDIKSYQLLIQKISTLLPWTTVMHCNFFFKINFCNSNWQIVHCSEEFKKFEQLLYRYK